VGVEINILATGRLLAATSGNNGRGEATADTNSMTLIARTASFALVLVWDTPRRFSMERVGRTNQDFDSTAAFSYQLMVGVYKNQGDGQLSLNVFDYHAHHAGWIFSQEGLCGMAS
jgi:hypothetical protein